MSSGEKLVIQLNTLTFGRQVSGQEQNTESRCLTLVAGTCGNVSFQPIIIWSFFSSSASTDQPPLLDVLRLTDPTRLHAHTDSHQRSVSRSIYKNMCSYAQRKRGILQLYFSSAELFYNIISTSLNNKFGFSELDLRQPAQNTCCILLKWLIPT